MTHRGGRYDLGYGEDFYGVWDRRRAAGDALQRFPRDDEGWERAWYRFQDLEAEARRRGETATQPVESRAVAPLAPGGGWRSVLATSDEVAVLVLRVVGWAALVLGVAMGLLSLTGAAGRFSRMAALLPGLLFLFQGVVVWAVALVLASIAENLADIRRNTARGPDSRDSSG